MFLMHFQNIFYFLRLLSNEVKLKTVKTRGLSSRRVIGQYVLFIFIKTCLCHNRSAFQKLFINDTYNTVPLRILLLHLRSMCLFHVFFNIRHRSVENAIV